MNSANVVTVCTLAPTPHPNTRTVMHESQLLSHIYARSAANVPGVLVGPGDDAAVVEIAGTQLLLTTDQLIEGRHYDLATPLDAIAHKALARSVSDIAAMGGSPAFALVTAALPQNFQGANELFDFMHTAATNLACPLVGGDISSTTGPAHFTTTLVGTPHPNRGPVLRSTAQPGDAVFVTGKIGGSYPSARHLAFIPRTAEARHLCDTLATTLHAMIDLSDGLGRDAARIATASNVRIELDADRIPLNDDAPHVIKAITDGEDYELLFTAQTNGPIEGATRIGTVTTGTGAVLKKTDGTTIDISNLGWDHQT